MLSASKGGPKGVRLLALKKAGKKTSSPPSDKDREDRLHKEYLSRGRGSGRNGEITFADRIPLRKGMGVQITNEGGAAKGTVTEVLPGGKVKLRMRDGAERTVDRADLLLQIPRRK